MAILLGKCLEMRLVVKPGKVVRWPQRMARRRVDWTGLPKVAWLVVDSKVVLRFIRAQDAVGLMRRRRRKWQGPKIIGHASAGNNFLIIFVKFDIVLSKNSNTIVVTELSK